MQRQRCKINIDTDRNEVPIHSVSVYVYFASLSLTLSLSMLMVPKICKISLCFSDLCLCYCLCHCKQKHNFLLELGSCDMAHVVLIITIHSSPFTTFHENCIQRQLLLVNLENILISFFWVFSCVKIRHVKGDLISRKKLFSHLLKMAFSNFFFGWLETEEKRL